MKLVEKFLLLVLISFIPTAYGQDSGCPLPKNSFASGVKPFPSRDVGCFPGNVGTGDQPFLGSVSTAQSVVHEVECQGGGSDCLVLSSDITEFFSIQKNGDETLAFFNAFSVRSADYRATSATLTIAATYMGIIEGSMKTGRGTETYSLVLRNDPPPVLVARDVAVQITKATGLEDQIFADTGITDTGTETLLADEVITSVRITQDCRFSHDPNTIVTDCLVIGDVTVPTSLITIQGDRPGSLKRLSVGISGYDPGGVNTGGINTRISGDKVPTTVSLSVTLESGLKSKVDDAGPLPLGRVTNTNTLEYELSFAITGIPPLLVDTNTAQTVFETGKRVFSSIEVQGGGARAERVLGLKIAQECEPSQEGDCVKLKPLLGSFPEDATVAEVEGFLRKIVAASTSRDVRSATLTVSVSVQGAAYETQIVKSELEYSLTFKNVAPVEVRPLSAMSTGLDVLGSTPFNTITVMDGPGEPDTIRSIVIDFECSRGRSTCVATDVSQIRGTAAQIQSFLRALEVVWDTDYKEPREATATIILETSARDIFNDVIISRETAPSVYQLSFSVSDKLPELRDSSTTQTIFRAGKRVFSSITVTDVDEGSGVELITSVRITQECKPNCARLGALSPGSFLGTTVRDTATIKVQDFSHEGASTAVVQAFLSSNIAMASRSEESLDVTLTVTVGSVLRGLKRPSAGLVYFLTFNGAPTVESADREGLDVLRSTPFSSITVTDDPREPDTIRSVVIEFECSGSRTDCVSTDDVSQIRGTAGQVQNSLRALEVVWKLDNTRPLVATATITLMTSLNNIFGDIVTHIVSGAPRLSFDEPELSPLELSDMGVVGDDGSFKRIKSTDMFNPLASITISGVGGMETISGIMAKLECVNGATTACASFVGTQPSEFPSEFPSGASLEDAAGFLKMLQVGSHFASYQAKLTVSVMASLRGLERPSNELTYTLTFPTPGSTDRGRLIDPGFAQDLGVVDPGNLAEVKEAVADHCGSDYFKDFDDDGVPNNVEAQLGTDCRNDATENVAGENEGQERPAVTFVGDLGLDKLPFIGNLIDLEIECKTCVEVLFLERQSECTSSDSVAGNGSRFFPGVNMSKCYLAGRFLGSTLSGTLFPRPSGSELYVLGIDKYGNWSVSDRGELKTQIVYTPPVLSLGPDVYSDTNVIGVELRSRRMQSGPRLPEGPSFTLQVVDDSVMGSFASHLSSSVPVPFDVSNAQLVTLVKTDIFDRTPPYLVMGRSTLTVIQGSPPPFISIGLQKRNDPASVISLEDDANSYSLNVLPEGAQSSVTIMTGDGMVLMDNDLAKLLIQVNGSALTDGVATLNVRVSDSGYTREAKFPVFSSAETAASAAAWTEAVVDRDIVVTSCLTDLCDPDPDNPNPFAYASVNLGSGPYLASVVASSITDEVSFDKVRETLNGYVSKELDLDRDQLFTDVISYSGAVSNVSGEPASFVFDFRHKPFTEDGRLVKRILVDGEYNWLGVDNDDIDGSVWYTAKRDSTCPSPDDDAAWTGTDNGLIPGDKTPIRCVRLDIVDGGLYANGSNGYYSGLIFGTDPDAFPLAHAGGGDGHSEFPWWIVISTILAFIYAGSAGVWTLFALASLLVLDVLLRRRRKRALSED